jgi:hypothetical protein
VSYAALLIALCSLLVLVPPLSAAGHGRGISFLLSLALLAVTGWAASDSPRLRRTGLSLLCLALISEGLVWAVDSTSLQLASAAILASYLTFVAGTTLRSVLQDEQQTRDAVLRGICAYLLVGVAFYFVLCVVETANPGAFVRDGIALSDENGAGRELGRYSDLLYFSFVTLTTLGYGDVLPVSPLARSLSTAIAVTGQLYLAVLMAVLVGRHLAQRARR